MLHRTTVNRNNDGYCDRHGDLKHDGDIYCDRDIDICECTRLVKWQDRPEQYF